MNFTWLACILGGVFLLVSMISMLVYNESLKTAAFNGVKVCLLMLGFFLTIFGMVSLVVGGL